MEKYIFATHNQNKFIEIQNILSGKVELTNLTELDFHEEIPETGNTLEHNAKQKADYIHQRFGANCFADDTGLEIEALDGQPSVYSARFAGEQCSAQDNIKKVLQMLERVENRKAVFRTVICLIQGGEYYYFEGAVHGSITEKEHGEKGFGYDPIFIPDGYQKSFAQMSLEEKNNISHRALATQKLVQHLLQ